MRKEKGRENRELQASLLDPGDIEEFCRIKNHMIDCLVAWSASIHSIGSGSQVYVSFWKSFQQVMGTQLMISTAFHPQMDGQSKRTIQMLEDMLRPCVLDLKGSWEEHLPLLEFAYNISY